MFSSVKSGRRKAAVRLLSFNASSNRRMRTPAPTASAISPSPKYRNTWLTAALLNRRMPSDCTLASDKNNMSPACKSCSPILIMPLSGSVLLRTVCSRITSRPSSAYPFCHSVAQAESHTAAHKAANLFHFIFHPIVCRLLFIPAAASYTKRPKPAKPKRIYR